MRDATWCGSWIPFVSALLVAGCGHGQSPAPATPAAANLPADLRSAVENAESFGVKIHLQREFLTPLAVKLLETKVPASSRQGLEGSVVARTDGIKSQPRPIWDVLFFTSEARPRVRYKVQISLQEGAEAPSSYETMEPPADPAPEVLALINARRSALAAVTDRGQPVKVVVLRELDGIMVYLLADTRAPDMAVLGKHYRAVVSPDGLQVIRLEALSREPLELPLRSADSAATKATALRLTETLWPHPTEAHVLASARHKLPVLVETVRGSWRVDGPRVSFLGPSR
jgi:hypothetical protein